MKYLGYLLTSLLFSSILIACSPQNTETTKPAQEAESVTEKKKEEHDIQPAPWSYTEEEGPESWGSLDQVYAACINGSEQSPINIEFSHVKPNEEAGDIAVQYEPAKFSLINNGHTVQVNNTSENNKIILEEIEYPLVQFHFHTPSEHQFNGRQYAMELHLVHQNEQGELAVLGLMIQEGSTNAGLQSVWKMLPDKKTEEEIEISDPIDLQSLLPQPQTFVYYNGSLTTPPCTEEVEWFVFEKPIEMSKEQIEAFQQIFPDNHRPVQPLNERELMKN